MTRRLVVVGRKVPEFSTRSIRYANREPLWRPELSPATVRATEPDPDDVRKYALEAFGQETPAALGRARREGFS